MTILIFKMVLSSRYLALDQVALSLGGREYLQGPEGSATVHQVADVYHNAAHYTWVSRAGL